MGNRKRISKLSAYVGSFVRLRRLSRKYFGRSRLFASEKAVSDCRERENPQKSKEKTAENVEKKLFAQGLRADILALKGVNAMFRAVCGVIAAVFLFFAAAFSAFGAEKTDLKYSIIDGEAVITGFTGEPTELEIPEFISCYPVTEIRDNAFCNCSTLMRISLPSTLAKLGHHSFYACDSLESIALPEGLAEIGEGCFCGCSELAAAELPDTLEQLPDSCFRACTTLKEITLPSSLKTMGAFCFAGCTDLEMAETGELLESMGDRAFFMCDRLNSFDVPSACTAIGTQALGYTCDGNMELCKRDMVIKGTKGSAAERYAADNGLRFYTSENAADSNGSKAAFLGLTVFLILTLLLLRIVLTDWSDQKLK